MSDNWFEDWFDSKYYHMLYHHRDEEEAHAFLQKLINRLSIEKNSSIIDIGCGTGRHAKYLNSLGFKVQGIDLSPSNIAIAKEHKNDSLTFEVCDMRNIYKNEHYDYVLNLFTSFGYFKQEKDNFNSFKAMCASLKKNGTLVLDYFNSNKLKNELNEEHQLQKCIYNVNFKTVKYIQDNHVVKDIEVIDNDEKYTYKEKVKLIDRAQFLILLKDCKMELVEIFGDYNLEPYDPDQSERMIIIAKK